MTNQETFDTVVAHLRKQGCRAGIKNACLYRDGDRKCAAGCLIPDDKYRPDMEGKSVYQTPVCQVLHELRHNIELVADLQTVHDRYDIFDWEINFKDIANKWMLKYVPIK